MSDAPFLQLRDIHRSFTAQGRTVRAVAGVHLAVGKGEILGIVGESGSGKSTVGRIATGLETAQKGQILIDGQDLAALSRREAAAARQRCQMVFQDPYSSLNPRLTVGRQVAESLFGAGWRDRSQIRAEIVRLFGLVGLTDAQIDRYPHEFSGGQRQRVAIARALAPKPDLIVADEAVSALDVTIQAQILHLLADIQKTRGLAFLFISHDIAVVAHLCQRIVVMHRGQIVEFGTTDDVVRRPRHPYTRSLLSAVPRLDRRRTGQPAPRHDAVAESGDTEIQMISESHGMRILSSRKPASLSKR